MFFCLIGPAMWIIFHSTDYGEPRVLVDRVIASTESITRVQSSEASSVKRVGLQCEDRPVGR